MIQLLSYSTSLFSSENKEGETINQIKLQIHVKNISFYDKSFLRSYSKKHYLLICGDT